jgi:hypothetical protein
VTEDNGRREMGELSAQVTALANSQATFRLETREDFARIFAKLETLTSEGCAVGRRNTERIKDLEVRPEKQSTLMANMASVLAAVVSFLAFWRVNQ